MKAGPLENAYLKLIAALALGRPHDTAGVVRAYLALFPDEGPVIDAIARDVFGSVLPSLVPELWLANDAFMTGTTVFDQFRAAPRVHTFDLNAATPVDLMGVPGMTLATADAVLRGAP